MENHEYFMEIAIAEAYEGIQNNEGGPFGAVVVKDGQIIGRGHNQVVKNNDPTCHGEIQAIRDACAHLNTFDLSGCDLYTTAAPCPMCLGAIQWANIKNVYYGCTVNDTDGIGFRDDIFYKNPVRPTCVCRTQCLKLFDDYTKLENKTNY